MKKTVHKDNTKLLFQGSFKWLLMTSDPHSQTENLSKSKVYGSLWQNPLTQISSFHFNHPKPTHFPASLKTTGFFLALELWMIQCTLDYQSNLSLEIKITKSLSPFMIITLITHPPPSRLSHHSVSYSNLPHFASLSMMNLFKLKSCIYFAEIQMIVQERSSGSEGPKKLAVVKLHPSKVALLALRQQREHREGCQGGRKCTF